jgi:hypothetical protein
MEKRDLVAGAAALVGTYVLSGMAFTFGARREIGNRDNWECQSDLCIGIEETGHPRSFKQLAPNGGYHVQAAHIRFPINMHQPKPDPDTEKGRILCSCCHISEHLAAGDIRAAKLLYRNQTIRNNEWIREHGHDEKEDFEFYQQLAEEQQGMLEG